MTSPGAQLLLVHREPVIAQAILAALGPAWPLAARVEDVDHALPLLRGDTTLELCLIDAPGERGAVALSRLRSETPEVELVALVPPGQPRLGPEALRAGCGDYLVWPSAPEELRALVARALDRTRLRREHQRLQQENLALHRAQALGRRCLGLLAEVELNPLQEHLLDLFTEVTDAQSSALWVQNERGILILHAHRGLWAKGALPPRLDPGEGPLASNVARGVPFSSEPPSPAGLFTPLRVGGESIGLLLLADKLEGDFTEEDRAHAEAASGFGAIALKNARRFATLQRVALRERRTPAYDLSHFIDFAGKELFKSHRYGRRFSLVAVRIDNLDELRGRLSLKELGEALHRFTQRLSELLRDADTLANVGEGEFYSVLPETDHFGALAFARRVLALSDGDREGPPTRAARSKRPATRVPEAARSPLVATVGCATFPGDGQDFDELLQQCRRRMDEGRQTLLRRLHLEPLDFWDSIEALIGPTATGDPFAQAGQDRSQATRPSPPEGGLFAAVQREIAREIARDPRGRGLVYVGTSELRPDLPILRALPHGEFASHIYLLGRRGPIPLSKPAIVPVLLDATPVAGGYPAHQHDFVLYLAERAAYGFIERRVAGGGGLHTCDRPLVDHLVARLQEAYGLPSY